MLDAISRREFFASGSAFAFLPMTGSPQSPAPASYPDIFPAQPAELVKEMVGVSHGNFDRVRQLVEARPALAKAAWDWGFGDWESAIDAASHVGNRPIAEYLISKGARPTLFTAAMLGQLDVVKGLIAATPGIQKTRGPHGITLLAHARFGGEQAADVRKYLESLGDADPAYTPADLADAERAALAGIYTFGTGPNDQFEVTLGKNGWPMVGRRGGTPRGLIHVGSLQFHPVGADAVRIGFEVTNGRAMSLVVRDADQTVTAKRSST